MINFERQQNKLAWTLHTVKILGLEIRRIIGHINIYFLVDTCRNILTCRSFDTASQST
jgi:hypothetical protein